MKDTFTTDLYDYGRLQLIADTSEKVATLQLINGAYSLPIAVRNINKDAAFGIYHSAPIMTYNEVELYLLGKRD